MNAAKGDTENANATLSYTKITSPIDGVVTDRPYYPGETPATGTPVITVMDLSQIVARSHVAQLEAASLKVGDPATITVPGQATPGERQSYPGESRGGRRTARPWKFGWKPRIQKGACGPEPACALPWSRKR